MNIALMWISLISVLLAFASAFGIKWADEWWLASFILTLLTLAAYWVI